LTVFTAAALMEGDATAEAADRKLGGGGDEYDDVLSVHLVQLVDLLVPDPAGDGLCSAVDNGNCICEDDAAAAAVARDDTLTLFTVCVALFSVTSALVCLSRVWSLHKADMSGKSRFRLFSLNDSMSNTAVFTGGTTVDCCFAGTHVVAITASAAEARRGRTMAAGFCNPVTGGGGGGGRRRNNTFGGTAGAVAVTANRSS